MMLIRSQDKRSIVNFDNVKEIGCLINDTEIFASFAGGTGIPLGEYSSEEKMIKVLDMLLEEYQKPVYRNVVAEHEIAVYRGKVFQMPQDEEVAV